MQKVSSYVYVMVVSDNIMCNVIIILDTIGFSQEVMTVWENEGIVNITVFSYITTDSIEDLSLSFSTFSGNATESKLRINILGKISHYSLCFNATYACVHIVFSVRLVMIDKPFI